MATNHSPFSAFGGEATFKPINTGGYGTIYATAGSGGGGGGSGDGTVKNISKAPGDLGTDLTAGVSSNGETVYVRALQAGNDISIVPAGSGVVINYTGGGGPTANRFTELLDVETAPGVPLVPAANQSLHYNALTTKWEQTPELTIDSASRNFDVVTTGAIGLVNNAASEAIAIQAGGEALLQSGTQMLIDCGTNLTVTAAGTGLVRATDTQTISSVESDVSLQAPAGNIDMDASVITANASVITAESTGSASLIGASATVRATTGPLNLLADGFFATLSGLNTSVVATSGNLSLTTSADPSDIVTVSTANKSAADYAAAIDSADAAVPNVLYTKQIIGASTPIVEVSRQFPYAFSNQNPGSPVSGFPAVNLPSGRFSLTNASGIPVAPSAATNLFICASTRLIQNVSSAALAAGYPSTPYNVADILSSFVGGGNEILTVRWSPNASANPNAVFEAHYKILAGAVTNAPTVPETYGFTVEYISGAAASAVLPNDQSCWVSYTIDTAGADQTTTTLRNAPIATIETLFETAGTAENVALVSDPPAISAPFDIGDEAIVRVGSPTTGRLRHIPLQPIGPGEVICPGFESYDDVSTWVPNLTTPLAFFRAQDVDVPGSSWAPHTGSTLTGNQLAFVGANKSLVTDFAAGTAPSHNAIRMTESTNPTADGDIVVDLGGADQGTGGNFTMMFAMSNIQASVGADALVSLFSSASAASNNNASPTNVSVGAWSSLGGPVVTGHKFIGYNGTSTPLASFQVTPTANADVCVYVVRITPLQLEYLRIIPNGLLESVATVTLAAQITPRFIAFGGAVNINAATGVPIASFGCNPATPTQKGFSLSDMAAFNLAASNEDIGLLASTFFRQMGVGPPCQPSGIGYPLRTRLGELSNVASAVDNTTSSNVAGDLLTWNAVESRWEARGPTSAPNSLVVNGGQNGNVSVGTNDAGTGMFLLREGAPVFSANADGSLVIETIGQMSIGSSGFMNVSTSGELILGAGLDAGFTLGATSDSLALIVKQGDPTGTTYATQAAANPRALVIQRQIADQIVNFGNDTNSVGIGPLAAGPNDPVSIEWNASAVLNADGEDTTITALGKDIYLNPASVDGYVRVADSASAYAAKIVGLPQAVPNIQYVTDAISQAQPRLDISALTEGAMKSALTATATGVANKHFGGAQVRITAAEAFVSGTILTIRHTGEAADSIVRAAILGVGIPEEDPESQMFGVALEDSAGAGSVVNVAITGICSVLSSATFTATRGALLTMETAAQPGKCRISAAGSGSDTTFVGTCMTTGAAVLNTPLLVSLRGGFEVF
jgi:hypothetical protein